MCAIIKIKTHFIIAHSEWFLALPDIQKDLNHDVNLELHLGPSAGGEIPYPQSSCEHCNHFQFFSDLHILIMEHVLQPYHT